MSDTAAIREELLAAIDKATEPGVLDKQKALDLLIELQALRDEIEDAEGDG